ncbi:MAG: hypothetical protein JETCAE03_33240 [Ignavibacteriaceae bacterium]|jgi:hypothetical protein|nr:MAG: hypothetical protein JETCAE03_33240 [Ignavibacteriaceae bacterium]
MKKAELRKMIKEELLKEYSDFSRHEGLVDRNALKDFVKAAIKINSSLGEEGFESDEIKEFLIFKINKIFK